MGPTTVAVWSNGSEGSMTMALFEESMYTFGSNGVEEDEEEDAICESGLTRV